MDKRRVDDPEWERIQQSLSERDKQEKEFKDHYINKICIIGNDYRLTRKIIGAGTRGFSDHSLVTGIAITTKTIKVNNLEVKLIIHIPRIEGVFNKLRRRYYEGSTACIIIFNKSDSTSFNTVSRWCQEYRGVQGSEKPVVILGVITDSEKITTEEGLQIADQLNGMYFEIDLKNLQKIEEIYQILAKKTS